MVLGNQFVNKFVVSLSNNSIKNLKSSEWTHWTGDQRTIWAEQRDEQENTILSPAPDPDLALQWTKQPGYSRFGLI